MPFSLWIFPHLFPLEPKGSPKAAVSFEGECTRPVCPDELKNDAHPSTLSQAFHTIQPHTIKAHLNKSLLDTFQVSRTLFTQGNEGTQIQHLEKSWYIVCSYSFIIFLVACVAQDSEKLNYWPKITLAVCGQLG